MRTIACNLFAMACTLVFLAPDAWGQTGRITTRIATRQSLPDANNVSSPEKPPAYERDVDFWRQRYQEVLKAQLPKFTPPQLGQHLTVVPRVGGPVTGELKALSDGIVIIGAATLRSSQLTPESCSLLFGADWAASQAKEIVTRERAAYEREEDTKWQRTYSVRKQQTDVVANAITEAKQDKQYDSAISALETAIEKNPEAFNIDEAHTMLNALRVGYTDAVAKAKQDKEAASLRAALRQQAWTSSENLALYLKEKLGRVYSRNGAKPFLRGSIRSGDVFVGSTSAYAEFRLFFGNGNLEVPEVRLGFTKDFGQWVLSEVTARKYGVKMSSGQTITKRINGLYDLFSDDGAAAYVRYLVEDIAKVDYRE